MLLFFFFLLPFVPIKDFYNFNTCVQALFLRFLTSVLSSHPDHVFFSFPVFSIPLHSGPYVLLSLLPTLKLRTSTSFWVRERDRVFCYLFWKKK
jgi:hypothetical protein